MSKTSGYRFKVHGRNFKRDLRGKSFHPESNWNELPEEAMKAGTVTTFKWYFDRYLNEQA